MGIRILYNFDTWDAGTITSSSEASTATEDDNAVNDLVGRPWRTDGDTSETWTNDLGAATSLTCFGMFGHNLTSAATVKLQGNASDSWGSPSYDQTLTIATDADGAALPRLVFFLSESYRYWHLDIADAANPDGFINIGRMVGGQYWEPTRTLNDGFSISTADLSLRGPQAGVGWYVRERGKPRTANVSFELFDRTQHDKFNAVFGKVGQSKPLVVALDPTNYPSADSMYCKIASPLSQVFREASLFDAPTLTFVEDVE